MTIKTTDCRRIPPNCDQLNELKTIEPNFYHRTFKRNDNKGNIGPKLIFNAVEDCIYCEVGVEWHF